MALSDPLLGPPTAAGRVTWSTCAGAIGQQAAAPSTLATDVAEKSLGLVLRAVLAGRRAAAKHYSAAGYSSSCSIAAASVILSLELVRIRKALARHDHAVRAHHHSMMTIGETQREAAQTLDDLFVELGHMHCELQQHAAERMLVYGILGKEGHRRRSTKLRMFVLDGADVSYYKLDGSTLKLRGSFPLAQIIGVERVGSSVPVTRWRAAKSAANYLSTIGVRDTSSTSTAADVVHRDYTLQVDLAAPSKLYLAKTWHRSYKLFAPDLESRDVWENALRPKMQGTLMCCQTMWPDCSTQWEPVHAVLHKSHISLCRRRSTAKASLERLHELKLMKDKAEAAVGTDNRNYLALAQKTRSEMQELTAIERETRAIRDGSLSILLTDVLRMSKQRVRIPENAAENGISGQFEMINVVLKAGTLHLRAAACGYEESNASQQQEQEQEQQQQQQQQQQQLDEWFVAMQRLLQSHKPVCTEL